jgi:hypothetical protein
MGVAPNGRFSPTQFYLASTWVFHRSLLERVGPWRSANEIWVTPSQDWIFRVHRSGARMKYLDSPNVFVIFSGHRSGSYTSKSSPEHDYYAEQMVSEPQFRELALQSALSEVTNGIANAYDGRLYGNVLRNLLYPLLDVLIKPTFNKLFPLTGHHPFSFKSISRGRRKGHKIRDTRKHTGLH